MPWPGEGGLARCWEYEMWPPRVFSTVVAWMDEGFRKGGRGGGGCCWRRETRKGGDGFLEGGGAVYL